MRHEGLLRLDDLVGAVGRHVLKGGDLTLNAVLTAGLPYFLSGTAGMICPEADLTTGMQKIQIGIAKSTTVLHVSVQDSGVTV